MLNVINQCVLLSHSIDHLTFAMISHNNLGVHQSTLLFYYTSLFF